MLTRLTLATTSLVLLAAGPAAARTPAVPIKREGATALPAFRGASATSRPITGIPKTPQNPFMAKNMDSGVHNDAWQTDAYTRSGPLGRSPNVFSADLGFAYELGNAIFLISRLPGLIAHAHEERTRQSPMRQIDPKDYDYDGAGQRRLPEGRK